MWKYLRSLIKKEQKGNDNMRMSSEGMKKLITWEGMETYLYEDVAGLKTIGVGHLLTRDELSSGKIWIKGSAVKYQNGLTEQQVYDLLEQDLESFEDAVHSLVKVELNQNQFDSLVSFSFNVGVNAFKNSTLLKRLNKGQYDEIPDQLRRWTYSGGKKVKGLVNRRENEIALWNS